MHEVLVNRLRGLSLPRKSVVRLTDRPDMTLDVYRGRKTTIQQQQQNPGSALQHHVLITDKSVERKKNISLVQQQDIKMMFAVFFSSRYSTIPILSDILSDSVKEKVSRIILATFRVSFYYSA